MVHTDTETMALSTVLTYSVVVAEKTATVLHICNFRTLVLYAGIRSVVHIVSREFHIAVKEVE